MLNGGPASEIHKFQHIPTHTSSQQYKELKDPEILMKSVRT